MKSSFLAALLLTIVLYSPVSTASEYKWMGQITEDGARLVYGIPNSDGIQLDFHCERKTRRIVVVFFHEPKEAQNGMRRTVRLMVIGRDPGLAVEISATGRRDELDDRFVFQGETRMSPQLRRILSEGGTLIAAIDADAAEIPLKDIAKETRQLFASCP